MNAGQERRQQEYQTAGGHFVLRHYDGTMLYRAHLTVDVVQMLCVPASVSTRTQGLQPLSMRSKKGSQQIEEKEVLISPSNTCPYQTSFFSPDAPSRLACNNLAGFQSKSDPFSDRINESLDYWTLLQCPRKKLQSSLRWWLQRILLDA